MTSKKVYKNSNPRYRNFTQTVFHAGDIEQFEAYREATNGEICVPRIDLAENCFQSKEKLLEPQMTWEGYDQIPATSVGHTFAYIFDKFKKGIFIKIQGNQLKVFLPFSKVNFVNEWGDRIKVDPTKYGSLNDFFQTVAKAEGRPFNAGRLNQFPSTWYGNNCLVRSEFPINEGDTGVAQVKDMFRTLCRERKVPDVEVFVNRRDFPLLKRNLTEPYDHLYDSADLPLLSHKYARYSPLLSNTTTDAFADVPVPTPDDWSRVSSAESKFFPKDCKDYSFSFDTNWADKKPIAVFRGSSTGCGITVETNARLKVASLSAQGEKDGDGLPFLDAGITKWNLRPRKVKGNPYLVSLDPRSLNFSLVAPLSASQQSEYKYIINIDGHVSAFRLSLELGTGSVILKVASPYKMWFSALLRPNVHYIPVANDLSDLREKIKWCKEHDSECETIARNARSFYQKYLSQGGILDYLQLLMVGLKKEIGVYLYNYESPLTLQIAYEARNIDIYFPPVEKKVLFASPKQERSYSLLQGTQWALNFWLQRGGALPQYKLLSESVHCRVYLRKFVDTLVVSKEIILKGKISEGIHDAFVGTRGVNLVLKQIPNFVYTFTMVGSEGGVNILQERIVGTSFFDYLKSGSFKVSDYLFLLIQISLALEVAQNTCGFVHYDLYPWNIVIQKTKRPVVFDYPLDKGRVMRVQSSMLPVIIDYGKSAIIYKGQHHGFVKPYQVSRIQDIISILVSSLNIILKEHRVSTGDFDTLLKLANFISGTGFNRAPFTRSKELKEFLRREHKFSIMLESDKHELEKRTPYSLAEYIQNKIPGQRFSIFKGTSTELTMDRGNSRQVFDYYFASNSQERVNSYTRVFLRLKKCSVPQPSNGLYLYFAAQSFYDNVTSVYKGLVRYLQTLGYSEEKMGKYHLLYQDTLNYLRFVYDKKLTENTRGITLTVDSSFKGLIPAPYSQETFLLPGKVYGLLELRGELPDLGDYRETFVSVFNNKGQYQLSEEARRFYSQNLKPLFDVTTLALKNNYANIKTLEGVSQVVYTNDLEALRRALNSTPADTCEDQLKSAQEYLDLYSLILSDLGQ